MEPSLFPFCNDLAVALVCALVVLVFIGGVILWYVWWNWRHSRCRGRCVMKERMLTMRGEMHHRRGRRWSTGSYSHKGAVHVEYAVANPRDPDTEMGL